jgi:ATP-dependent protease Clp ATPase subunit
MNDPEPTCSFCHQPKSKVLKLLVGDGQTALCNYCVALCYNVLRREGVDMTLHDAPPNKADEAGR